MAVRKQKITKITELQQNPIDVERHQLNDGRWYSPTDTWWEKHGEKDTEKPYFRSITTIPNVFDKGIGWNKWLGNAPSYADAMEYGNMRANIGTLVHILIERGFMLKTVSFDDEVMGEYLETLDLDFDPYDIWRENRSEIIKYMMSFAQFYTERQPTPLALEIQLMNIEKNKDRYKYPFAGTADFIGSMNYLRDKRKFGYVDWKTGLEYPSHQLQAIATKILWDSIYPDMPLDFLADVYLKSSWRGTPKYGIKWMEFKPKAWEVSLLANKTVNYLNNTRVKEPNEEIKPKFPIPLPDEIKLEDIEE